MSLLEQLNEDSLMDVLLQLSPLELLKLKAVSSKFKSLIEQSTQRIKNLTVEYRGFIPMFNRHGATHQVNGHSLDIKDELLFISKIVKELPNIWSLRIRVKALNKISFEILCESLGQHCANITNFSLAVDRFNVKYDDIQFEQLASAVPSIKHISIGDGVTETDLANYLEKATNVETIELLISSDKMTGMCLRKCGPHVREISVKGSVYWWELMPSLMRELTGGIKERNGTPITTLKFKCKGVKQDTISSLGDQKVYGQLTTLSFDRPPFYVAEVRFVDLAPIASLKNLTHLDLNVFTFIDDEDVNKILHSCNHLLSLSLKIPPSNFHKMVTDTSVSKIPKLLPKLEHLVLQNVRLNEATLEGFAALKCLEQLFLADVSLNSSLAVRTLLDKSNLLKHLTLIQCFNLSKRQLCLVIDDLIQYLKRNRKIHKVVIEQETIYDPPVFHNVPKVMKLVVKRLRS
ncbi:hypothetical protein HDE_10254 [Halotydeus destructor]|nr:hypothetical protein HDE_10254 [Halotydeus destructor]